MQGQIGHDLTIDACPYQRVLAVVPAAQLHTVFPLKHNDFEAVCSQKFAEERCPHQQRMAIVLFLLVEAVNVFWNCPAADTARVCVKLVG